MLSQWPNGQGVGFRSRRLWVRVPSGMAFPFLQIRMHAFSSQCAGAVPTFSGACSVMVIIGASQALDPGSIPGRRNEEFFTGALAQSEECVLCKHEVRGSKPRCSINFFAFWFVTSCFLIFFSVTKKAGSMGELNPRPLAP